MFSIRPSVVVQCAGRALAATLPLRALLGVVAFLLGGLIAAQAYPNEVYTSDGTYRWKINNVEAGSTSDLATAINNCISQTSGVREVHVLVGGDLASTIGMRSGLRLYCHNVSFTRSHGGTGFHHEGGGDIHVYDMSITSGGGWGIHTSRASNLVFQGINITSGGIGIRVDSHPSRPYEAGRWVYNLSVLNCRFENLGSHGLETYGIDGFTIDNIVARNNAECGVLINKGYNGTIGTVDAYRCSNGGGYAGLRFANDCANVWVKSLRAVECGRGFFTVTGAKNIVVEEVYIRDCTSHAILLQNSDGVGVNSGSYNGVALNHYTSVNSWILARDVSAGAITPPAAPSGVTAVAGASGVAVTWPAVGGATHYLLHRAETIDGAYRTIAYRDTTSFEDRNVTGNATYFYLVKAVNAGGPGVASAPASISTSGHAFPVVDLNAGLQLHYPFDGSGAESRGGPPVSISGTATYVPGLANQALAFDGATNFATLQPLGGSGLRDFTAAAWLWRGSDANWQRIFDFGSGTSDYFILTLVNGALRFNLSRGGSVQGFETPAPPRDRWAHVAVTFVGNWATLYVNGAARGRMLFANGPAQLGTLAQSFLGKSQFSDPLFTGRLDDFHLYARGLAPAEVLALVTSSPPVPPFDLTAGGFGTRVSLTWAAGVNASAYNVKRATASGGPYATVATGVAGTAFTDTGLASGITYYYVVTASNPHGESAPSNEAAVTTSDLVARITFNETAGSVATDASGNSRHATLVNGPAFAPGVLKNALTLSSAASQHATLPAGVVSELNDFTLSLWVRVSSFDTWARLFDFGTGTTNYMFLSPQYATGTNAAKMRFGIRTPSIGEQTITSSTALPLDTWTHVAVTLSGTTGRMYLNGTLVGTNSTMTLKPSNLGVTTLNYLGRSQFADPYFNGSVDDFRIYVRALSGSELSALATPVAEAPDTLTAVPEDGKVSLTWALADGATSYDVLRASTSGGPYVAIAPNLVASTYLDTAVVNGTTYYYVVTGSNSRGGSAGTSPVAAATPTTLRVHLKLDETSGTVASDSSGRGRDATMFNNPAWVGGRMNNGLQLASASSQYAILPAGIVDGLTDFTISTWVRVSSFANWARIFDFGTGTTNYLFLVAQYDGTNAPRRMRFATRSTSVTTEQQITSSAALPLNTWAHVAVTLSGTTGRLYLNGVLVGTNTGMTLNPSALGAVTQSYLGKSMFAADPYFNGAIDDFRVMTVALSDAQIAELAAPPAVPSGLDATSENEQVSLSWNTVAGATGYVVKRSVVSGGPYATIASNVSVASYTDPGLDNGTTYYYVVSALKGLAESGDSTEAVAAPVLLLAPIESWRLTHFGSTANNGSGADSADPDGDGLANLLEYALGADPGVATAAPYQLQFSNGVLRLVFERIADPDLVYEVQASSDFAAWNAIWSSSGDDNTEGVVVVPDDTPLSAGTRRFLRLRVSASVP
jgi:fibronectin type 3 domain-containing protein